MSVIVIVCLVFYFQIVDWLIDWLNMVLRRIGNTLVI